MQKNDRVLINAATPTTYTGGMVRSQVTGLIGLYKGQEAIVDAVQGGVLNLTVPGVVGIVGFPVEAVTFVSHAPEEPGE